MSLKKKILINLLMIIAFLSIGELLTRIFVNYKTNFYALPQFSSSPNTTNIHPYGKIPINSKSSPDEEWNSPKTKKRYAYIGDSVVYGVGAGYPFRITEYLDRFAPNIEHINISDKISFLIEPEKNMLLFNEFIIENKIDKIVYLMNLTDIADFINVKNENKNVAISRSNVAKLKDFIYPVDNFMRLNSNLYNYVRFKFKNILITNLGLNISGYKAIELEPNKNEVNIKNSAKNLAIILKNKKISRDICIIMLPYEMQISKDASKQYKKLGIKYDNEFLEFKTQKIFTSEFKKNSNSKIYFLNNNFPEAKVGRYFVFNLGDKIDFNHPNRYGHKILAKQIVSRKICI